ncbi:hypothetical protein Btru_023869 [Bulinus truncatus]|nr:hypothetical protein Btru_023869 [Bulinus truncatus]
MRITSACFSPMKATQVFAGMAQSSTKENKPVSGNKKSASLSGGSSTAAAGSGGWKSIFSKPRSGSVKKARKSSQESVTLGPVTAKAITEEDVHNWKRHLRSAKSAESLFSITNTGSSRAGSISSRTSQSNTENSSPATNSNKQDLSPAGKAHPGKFQLSHKRSLSSDAPAVLRSRQISQESSHNDGILAFSF